MLFSGAKKRSPEGYLYRPLKRADIDAAVAIVAAHDEDDAAEAAYALTGDLSGFFVVDVDRDVAGFTGYERICDAPTSAWLSWTYVRADMRKRGVGAFMMEQLRFSLASTKVERLFIDTSDYKEDGVDIYADARRFYERLGARCDIVIPHFYAPDEQRFVYRLPLEGAAFVDAPSPAQSAVRFVDIDRVSESETGFCLLWEECAPGEEGAADALVALADAARNAGAHAVFASLPSPYSAAAAPMLEQAQFAMVGAVNDYYSAGVNDVYWTRTFF